MATSPIDQDAPAPFQRLARFRSLFGPPLLPSATDTEWCWESAAAWIHERGAARVLLLGVTPEYHPLPWPPGTDVLLVDISQVMIDAMWPGPREQVLCANWLSMGLPAGSRDLALCDGGLPILEYPREQREFVRALHDVLPEGGLCIMRTFVLPPRPETPDAVIGDFVAGSIATVSTLVLRMNMALQDTVEEGNCFGRTYQTIGATPGLERIVRGLGWTDEHLALIADCTNVESKWHVPTLEQTVDLFCREPGGFRLESIRALPGDVQQRCPTLTLRRC